MIARLKNPSWRQSVAKVLCFVRGCNKKARKYSICGLFDKTKITYLQQPR
jgi:hypothetical protein